MKKILLVLSSLLLLGASLHASTTVISATVTDTDGTVWANGIWSITFNPNPAQPNPNIYNINGTPLSSSITQQSGNLDGSGAFSVTIYDSTSISPSGSGWTLKVCPNSSAPCGVYIFSSAGSTMDLSSTLTSIIPPPRFHPVSGSYGYNDAEAVIELLPGSTYWNVTIPCQKVYNGSSWSCLGTGTGTVTCDPLTAGYYLIATGTSACADGNIWQGATNLNVGGAMNFALPDNFNTDVGGATFSQLTTGIDNTALGYGALDNITTTSANTGVGYSAGEKLGLVSGIFVGAFADAQNNGDVGEIVIGASVTGNGSHTVTIGDSGITDNYFKGVIHASSIANGVTATTQSPGDSTTKIATDAFVLANSGGITQLTGDVTAGPGSGSQAATLAAVGSAGSCGDSTHSCSLTFDSKGRETAQSNVAISSGFTSGTGWTKDPTGHIHQWGCITGSGSISTGTVVTFPTAFTTTANLSVNATSITIFGNGIGFISIESGTVTTTQFTVETGAQPTTDGLCFQADGN